ncbi:M56 family metallopeptidase [Streptomyces coeruleorubidus]|uniref:M56 family metallopeptidase n=1 Tax=Streptomyces coeruleorubidus TaxID=116188 RepID=UPI00237F85CD|nr:M56 family metallopeptidase [Streptomyces coeruleorubidus]WDV52194.1 M56 family metallopeptidase [Streptomyces coeruleorubidus]
MTELLGYSDGLFVPGHHVLPPVTIALVAGVSLARALARSHWAHRTPRLALAVWILLGLSLIASVSMTALQLLLPTASSHHLSRLTEACVVSGGTQCGPLPPDGLAGVDTRVWAGLFAAACVPAAFAVAFVRELLSARRLRVRHAELLRLVGNRRPELGATVLQHDTPAVYCLPGRAPEVVVSSGALQVLTGQQMTAVLAHERAHIAGRHHLLVAAAGAFGAIFRGLPLARLARTEVPLLLEMAADDRALRRCSRDALATALYAVASGQAPHMAFAAGGPSAVLRMRRILTPHAACSPTLRTVCVALTAAAALTPLVLACCSVPGITG